MKQLFDIKPGTRLRKQDMKEGTINYVGASAFNNGVTTTIGNNDSVHPGGTISVCYNGSIGKAFYQSEPFWATDDVNVLYPKFELTPDIALFLIPVIYKVSLKYAYSDKWTADRMELAELPLPSTETGEPDWEYMKRFMKGMSNRAKLILSSIS